MNMGTLSPSFLPWSSLSNSVTGKGVHINEIATEMHAAWRVDVRTVCKLWDDIVVSDECLAFYLAPLATTQQRIIWTSLWEPSRRSWVSGTHFHDFGADRLQMYAGHSVERALADTYTSDGAVLFPLNGTLPSLSFIRLDMSFLLWGAIPICLNLRVMVLHHVRFSLEPSIDDFCSLFNCTPRLERLHLRYIECKSDDGPSKLKPILPCLTHLFFKPISESSFKLVAAIDMPHLRNLHLDMFDEASVHHVSTHLQEVLLPVTTASLDVVATCTEEIWEIIRMMPNLCTLDGRRSEPYFSRMMHKLALCQREACPKLSTIVLGEIPDMEMIEDTLHAGSTFGPDLHEVFPDSFVRNSFVEVFLVGQVINRREFAKDPDALYESVVW
ncbi:hypothetical protein C8J57DRAFT_1475791 [Mycena rebaudengoi]|nr:hypothetical protein C8J57DRAFT_1486125 [Mycena rebaudengoi]KAJ7247594.1 hypothetical protein C8J57DRAFT_1475791 [Mycena rebaudengoi]